MHEKMRACSLKSDALMNSQVGEAPSRRRERAGRCREAALPNHEAHDRRVAHVFVAVALYVSRIHARVCGVLGFVMMPRTRSSRVRAVGATTAPIAPLPPLRHDESGLSGAPPGPTRAAPAAPAIESVAGALLVCGAHAHPRGGECASAERGAPCAQRARPARLQHAATRSAQPTCQAPPTSGWPTASTVKSSRLCRS